MRFELTQPVGNGFTDRPDSPTSALPHVWSAERDLNPQTLREQIYSLSALASYISAVESQQEIIPLT